MRAWSIQFGAQRGPHPAGLVLMLIGLMCLALGGRAFMHAHQARQQADRERAQIQQQAESAAQAIKARLVPALPHYAQDKRWQLAARELTRPWLPTLNELERVTKPPVFLIGMKTDPVSGLMQLDAQAPSLNEVLTYTKALQGIHSLYEIRLLRHEQVPDTTGGSSVRFVVQGTWRPAQP